MGPEEDLSRNTYRRSLPGLGRKKMKRLMFVLTVLFVFNISAFAQRSTGQGGGMMGGGWGWGMNSGWIFMIIIAILVILGIGYLMKRK
jgi:hypothetical protein